MAKNTGKEYEVFIKAIYESILKIKGLEKNEVKLQDSLPGKTLDELGNPIKHEIDVHWDFEIDGKTYRTVIQAKDWINRVKKGNMIEFDGIIDDMPVSTDGIFISKSGFQSGAISWARAKGIEAKELRSPRVEELENRIQHIIIDFHITAPCLLGVQDIVLDQTWVESLSPEELNLFGPILAHPPSIHAETEDGKAIGNLVKVALEGEAYNKDGIFSFEKVFEPPIFLTGLTGGLSRIKVRKFISIVEVVSQEERLEIHAVLTHVLRSVTGKDSYFIATIDDELRVFPVDDLPQILKKNV